MKKYIEPEIKFDLFTQQDVVMTASGVLQAWREEDASRRTSTVDWLISEIFELDF